MTGRLQKKNTGGYPVFKSAKPSQAEELGNLQTAPANGAGQVACVNTTNRGRILILLLENTRTLNSEFTATRTLDLNVKRLRPKILISIIN